MERHNLKKENSPSQERISDTSHINSLKTLCFSFLICEMRNNCGCLAGLPCRLHKEPFCDLWPGPSRACGESCLALQPNFGMPRERTWFSTFSGSRLGRQKLYSHYLSVLASDSDCPHWEKGHFYPQKGASGQTIYSEPSGCPHWAVSCLRC